MSNAIFLAIETSGDVASVALWAERRVVWERSFPDAPRGGNVLAVGTVEALALGYVPTAVAVGIGPGSYTGTRLGLTFGKMFAFARGLPLYGISGLEGLARHHGATAARVAVSMAAHPGRVYAALYDVSTTPPGALQLPSLVDSSKLRLAPFAGAHTVTSPPERVTAAMVARVAFEHWEAGTPPADPDFLEPLYLQASAPERKVET